MDDTSRIFHIKDGVLKEHGQTVLKMLPIDIHLFAELDTTFSQQTVNSLSQGLQKVDGEIKDETLVAEMMGNTQSVTGLMQQCHRAYNTTKYFVDKAFGDNAAVRREFRMGDLHKVKNSQVAMIDMMETIALAIIKHQDSLITSGMSQAKIDAITPLAEQLKSANAEQETSKNERPLGTQGRVGALNSLYLILKQISDAAGLVFEDNEAKMKAYKLPTS